MKSSHLSLREDLTTEDFKIKISPFPIALQLADNKTQLNRNIKVIGQKLTVGWLAFQSPPTRFIYKDFEVFYTQVFISTKFESNLIILSQSHSREDLGGKESFRKISHLSR